MQRLSYIDKAGREVSFDNYAPYIFWRLEGLSLPSVEPIYTQAMGQDGYTLGGVLLSARTIRLEAHIHGKNGLLGMYEARRRLNSVCNPLSGAGTLVYENDSGKWRIAALCVGMPYAAKVREIQTLSVDFECPSPFWLAENATEISLSYVGGGLTFPLKTPGMFGLLGYRAVIDNDSDARTPVELWIGGGGVNPTILNRTTGEFIRVDRAVAPSDRLYINTDPESLEASLISVDPETNQPVKTNSYGYLSFDSSLFQLVPGINDLTFISDDGNRKVKVLIKFYTRRVGV